jgi:integrase
LDYRYDGKRKTLSFGAYPAVSLRDARARREEAKEQLARGIDPGEQKKVAKAAAIAERKEIEKTFEAVAHEWMATKADTFAASNTKKKEWIIGLLAKHIGEVPVSRLKPVDILSAIRPVEGAGHIETAHKMAQAAGQICRYARTCGYAEFNPADGLTGVLKPSRNKHHAAIIDPAEVGALLRAIDSYPGTPVIRYALKILPYVALRSTELRGARWTELNLDEAVWTVPASRKPDPKDGGGMKMRVAHIVPLSSQVVTLFRELHLLTGIGYLCFPSEQSATQPISDMGLLNALRRMGYAKGEMTVHGFRGMFSSLVNAKKLEWGIDADVIERQLAHTEGNKIRGAYNHAEYLPERRRMMSRWADYLDGLRRQS